LAIGFNNLIEPDENHKTELFDLAHFGRENSRSDLVLSYLGEGDPIISLGLCTFSYYPSAKEISSCLALIANSVVWNNPIIKKDIMPTKSSYNGKIRVLVFILSGTQPSALSPSR